MSRQTRSSSRKASRPSPAATLLATPPPQDTTSQVFDDPSSWESWLSNHHSSQPTGTWLRIAKKNSGITTVTYDEALDAALCYGWIDGQRKALDDTYFVQRFTPRRKTSIWSKRNVDKVAVLVASARMQPPGQVEVDAAKADGRWERAYAGSSNAKVPPDFQAALDGNMAAGRFFETITRTQRYAFLFRLETAKRPDTRLRRMEQFVKLLAEEKCL
ncbi:bacteriocin-protection, YdeI or OmpD-associated-domain-containing protein [Dactylonectria estremocensis]|uniref:Bacteriocin-protection, YdeI or OmpD-associated-domain-containing protein n=1 Tax=Dactylonectria estremocensis TaxID=1079267 RepID=A0A9P9ETU7_9HYPO|nr:bacteriocin-protection, YdeI or OmpD-associated-domain-containing protein [Dactylonectria estremocensis]